MNFLRNLLAAILGTLIALGILFFMFMILGALMGRGGDKIVIPDNSVLELKFTEPLKDYGGSYKLTDFNYKFEEYNGLNHVLNAIRKAKTDDKIKGISITSNFLMAGMAQTQAMRNALKDFKKSGKFVYAYGDFFLQKDYYLASVADSVFLNPVGEMDFRGLASEVLYFKDIQEKTGVKVEVVRHGKYKSAVEPYLANKMSDANRKQISELLESLWTSILKDIGESRNLDESELNKIADDLGARSPELAIKSGLIDGTIYLDEYEDLLGRTIGLKEEEELEYVDIKKYAQYASKSKHAAGIKNEVAVIYAQGEIMYAEGNDEIVGQGIMVKAIRDAREDDDIKAVVLRVDSPGGAALVADIIWRELELTQKQKPLVVSMGDVAASGGYYIAAGADKIYAEPTTITGSIGVFGTIPNIKGLADKIGINAEQVETNAQSSGYSVFEPMSEEFRDFIKEGIEEVYATFLQRVATGRNMTLAQVDSIAQGRVWSGTDAKKLGLIDELGGLEEAIAEAASLAELETYKTRSFPVYETSVEDIIEELSGVPLASAKEKAVVEEIGQEAYNILKYLKKISEQKGIQARLPFELNIK